MLRQTTSKTFAKNEFQIHTRSAELQPSVAGIHFAPARPPARFPARTRAGILGERSTATPQVAGSTHPNIGGAGARVCQNTMGVRVKVRAIAKGHHLPIHCRARRNVASEAATPPTKMSPVQ